MIRVTSNSVLVVPPFECAWLCEDLKFKQPGEGCVAFEARADNDVTIVFKVRADVKDHLFSVIWKFCCSLSCSHRREQIIFWSMVVVLSSIRPP